MRIVYSIKWNAFRPSGVLRKVEAQARAWNELGHETRIFVMTPPGEDPPAIDPAMTTCFVLPSSPRKGGKPNTRSIVAGLLERDRELRHFRPDVIYHRLFLSVWNAGLCDRLRRTAPYVVEINSLAMDELKLDGRLRGYHPLVERFLLGGARGVVAVSGELARHYAGYGRPTIVIANGYPAAQVQPRTPPRNARPQLVFVGAQDQPWHGADKIAILATRFPGCDFHVVGPVDPGFSGAANVRLHGILTADELTVLYRGIDVGIGTLALHRKNMVEASPLKVREYVAYGIPVIAGYIDTDLDGCDFFLNIGNTESNVIDGEASIRDFLARWSGRSIDRAEVLARIDVRAKEPLRLAFLEEAVARAR